MTPAHWLSLLAMLLFTLPAEAQMRRTHLTDGGRRVVEAVKADLAECEVVYRWDRCRSSRRKLLNVLTSRGEQRRANCIVSSRNVSARKGATHYLVQGAVFTGYRCGGAPPPEPAPPAAQAAADPAAEALRVERERYRALGFAAWGGVCTATEELFSDRCDSLPTSYERVTCKEAGAKALTTGERIYYQPEVASRIDYDGKTQAFTVQFQGVLGRLGVASDQRYVTTSPLVAPRGGTVTEALADAAAPFGQLTVPVSELAAPELFEKQVLLEALIRPKALHAPAANNPSQIAALEVDVVGLRAYLPDLSWGAVVVPSPEGIASYRCPALKPSDAR